MVSLGPQRFILSASGGIGKILSAELPGVEGCCANECKHRPNWNNTSHPKQWYNEVGPFIFYALVARAR